MTVPSTALTSDLTVLILTFNEEQHIARCIESTRAFARRVVVIDSGSTDATCRIAADLGAEILVHPFRNHAAQFNWGLDHAGITTTWVMRLDADEYLTASLPSKLSPVLANAPSDVDGVTLNRRLVFQGRWLRHGGIYPVRVLRVWRFGKGRVEQRLMDEHVSVLRNVVHVDADFTDENLKSLTWWTEKHNGYASKEAVELLNLEHRFLPAGASGPLRGGSQAAAKRWIKENVYAKLPAGLRSLAYFLYRYLLLGGFLDGRPGANFHILQGFWYRYLVDAKVAEVNRRMITAQVDAATAIEQVLGLRGLAEQFHTDNEPQGTASPGTWTQ